MAIQNLGNEHTIDYADQLKGWFTQKWKFSLKLFQTFFFFPNILQNTIFCVEQKKEMNRDLEQLEDK